MSLFPLPGNERQFVFAHLCMCVWTLGSLPSLIHGDVRWTVICSACQPLTAAEAPRPVQPGRLIYWPNLAGWHDSQPAGKAAGNLVERGRAEATASGASGTLRPQSLHCSSLRACVIYCHPNYIDKEVTVSGCLSAGPKCYSRGVG